MSPPRRPWARRLVAAGLLATAALLSGCVYLRLLELKLQLGRFDEHFTLQTTDGLALICLHPVVRSGDVRWLGIKSESIQQVGHAAQWRIRWVKQLPAGETEAVEYDIVVDLTFTDDRLTRLSIPERYFAVMPKDFLVGVVKSLGRGRVDAGGKRIEATVTAAAVAATRPRLPALHRLLGRPTETKTDGPRTTVRYRYVPATKESAAGIFDMHLTFDTATGELRRWQGFTPVGRIGFDFPATTP
jgi:hypothetical protein